MVLAVAALISGNAQMVHAAYLAMEPIARFAIVPLAFASLLTGLISALGTPWGLFRHYWVVVKLLLTVVATFILLGNMRTVGALAGLASETDLADPSSLPGQILHSGGGLLVLLVAATLGVYKPRGMTRYGWRKQHEQ